MYNQKSFTNNSGSMGIKAQKLVGIVIKENAGKNVTTVAEAIEKSLKEARIHGCKVLPRQTSVDVIVRGSVYEFGISSPKSSK